ncbi:Kdo2-lipid IVA lauroyltransferase/acyltransferase [Gammaproteobacteria bacterium]
MMREQLIWGLVQFFSVLPLRTAQGIGAVFGGMVSLFPNKTRRIVEINLRLCFPEMGEVERRHLIRRTLIEIGKSITEIGPLWLWDAQRILGLVKGVSGEEAFRADFNQGRGIILAGPHLGGWEMAGIYLSAHYPITILYRPLRLIGLGERVHAVRSRNGARLAATDKKGIKSLYQTLARGEVAVILPDHNPGRGMGVFAPFFNVTTNTMVLLPRLAAKDRVPVYFIYAERLPRGEGFHIHFIPGDPEISDPDIVQGCTHLNAGVENCIRRHPAQYQWGYKRFRVRPEGEVELY